MHITYAVKYFIQIVGSHAQKIYQCGFKVVCYYYENMVMLTTHELCYILRCFFYFCSYVTSIFILF